jgi:hypothetical protein
MDTDTKGTKHEPYVLFNRYTHQDRCPSACGWLRNEYENKNINWILDKFVLRLDANFLQDSLNMLTIDVLAWSMWRLLWLVYCWLEKVDGWCTPWLEMVDGWCPNGWKWFLALILMVRDGWHGGVLMCWRWFLAAILLVIEMVDGCRWKWAGLRWLRWL